ncbi:MAG: glycosyltransferase family 4 protein [Pseudomonadales bacterium]|nr:glycosyltransferase family 4 protein [Pseudomonadales bacterium]
MKILCITSSYPVTPRSNSGIFVKRLVDEMAVDNEVAVITPAYKNIVGKINENPAVFATRYAPNKFQVLCHDPGGIPAILKADKRFLLAVPFLLISLLLKSLFHARHYDIIQANWAICGAIAGFAGLVTGTPLVTTLRGDDVNGAKKSIINRLFLLAAIHLSKTIITVSDEIKDQLITGFNISPNKILTIPNGVNEAFLSRGRQLVENDDGQRFRLIAIGSLIPRKNISFLVNALSKLPAHIQITIAGNGEEKEKLLALSKTLQIENKIHFLGAVDPDEMPALIAEHDLFVLCSVSEGRSNAVYEAMACGKSIIATDIPGTKEQISHGQTGFLFPLEDSPERFIELVKILEEQRGLAYQLGKNAHQWIIDNGFTWGATKENYLTQFRNVLGME